MRPEFQRSASPSPESNSAKAKAVLESRRVRSSFSFDPMAVAPLFQGMSFAVDVDHEDEEFAVEIAKMITRLGGTIVRLNKMEPSTVLIWRRGDIANLEKADELGCTAIGQKFLFDCIEKNERLALDRYLVSKADRDDGVLRRELCIKRLGKNKRTSAGVNLRNKTKIKGETGENRQVARASKRIEQAFQNKDLGEVLKGMANTIKELCPDDPDLKEAMEVNSEPIINQSFDSSHQSTAPEKRSKMKKTKKVENEPSNKKPAYVIPASSFLRCLQNEHHKLVLYQGNFTLLHDLLKLKTEDGSSPAFFKVDTIHLDNREVELVIVLHESANSMGLLHALLKGVPIVSHDYVHSCLRARKILSPTSAPQCLMTSLQGCLKSDIFARTTFKVHSSDTLKEMRLKIWTARTAIEKLGGRLSDALALVDIVIVLEDDQGNLPPYKSLAVYATYLIRVVNERWLVDSIFGQKKITCKDPLYEISSEQVHSVKKPPPGPQARNLKDFFKAG